MKALILLTLLLSTLASAENHVEGRPPQEGSGIDFAPKENPGLERFTAERWSRGIHLFAGLGLNSSLYRHEEEDKNLGMGLGLVTAAAYVLNPDWMIDISSNVGFRQVHGLTMWDSVFGPGARYRIHPSYYVRGFAGWGMEVLVGNEKDSRSHLTGPIGGAGFGYMHGKAKETVWFAEFVTYVHHFEHKYINQPQGDVSFIVDDAPVSQKTGISFALSAGLMVF